LNGNVTELQSEIAQLNGQVVQLEGATRGLDTKLTEVNSRTIDISTDIELLKQLANSTLDRLTAVCRKVNDTEIDVDVFLGFPNVSPDWHSCSGHTAYGDDRGCVEIQCRLADLEWRAGAWADAASRVEKAGELSGQFGLEDPEVPVFEGFIEAHRGNVEGVRAAAEQGAAIADRIGDEVDRLANVAVLGVLELSRGNLPAADGRLRPLLEWLVESRWALATGTLTPFALEALIAVGEHDEAQVLVAQFEREGQALESPWVLALGAHLRGLLRLAEGDVEGARLLLERALVDQERGGWPFERARTLFAIGQLERRAKQKRAARESLEAALVIFEELGARLWAEKTRAELRRIGGRASASGALTPSEERVAALVAEGKTNREVAAALFVSERTVEGHLTRIYPKLGVRSRTELARRLAAQSTQHA